MTNEFGNVSLPLAAVEYITTATVTTTAATATAATSIDFGGQGDDIVRRTNQNN
jgi:ABC-type proline/glycine betaine transport system permease subunit